MNRHLLKSKDYYLMVPVNEAEPLMVAMNGVIMAGGVFAKIEPDMKDALENVKPEYRDQVIPLKITVARVENA